MRVSNQLRDVNAYAEVITHGFYTGRCESTGLPQYSDSQMVWLPMWLEFIADRANQSLKRASADDRIVELRGTLYQSSVKDAGVLDNLFDAGLKTVYFKTISWADKWIVLNVEIQNLGTSHLGLAQRYLGTPIVAHGRSQFITGSASDVLPAALQNQIS